MDLRNAARYLLRSLVLRQTSLLKSPNEPSNFNFLARCTASRFRTLTSTPTCKAVAEAKTGSPKAEDIKKPSEPNQEGIAESLDWVNAGIGGNRTSRFSSTRAQAENRKTSPFANRGELDMNGGNSAEDLLSAFNVAKGVRSRNDNFADKMMDPAPKSGLMSSLNLMQGLDQDLQAPRPPKIPLRLNPQAGRTVMIGAGVDVGRGFRLLDINCARNRVRSDMMKQRFHERPGLKRKRLHRERWRKRFMLGFKAAVTRVKELKKQGW